MPSRTLGKRSRQGRSTEERLPVEIHQHESRKKFGCRAANCGKRRRGGGTAARKANAETCARRPSMRREGLRRRAAAKQSARRCQCCGRGPTCLLEAYAQEPCEARWQTLNLRKRTEARLACWKPARRGSTRHCDYRLTGRAHKCPASKSEGKSLRRSANQKGGARDMAASAQPTEHEIAESGGPYC